MENLPEKFRRVGMLDIRPAAAAPVAAALYLTLAAYLYNPYLDSFAPIDFFFLLNSAIGALGCFVITMRWVSVFWAALLAGAVYGFSPYALAFAAYHPFAGLAVAAMPWLFAPATFWRHRHRSCETPTKRRETIPVAIVTAALFILPFAVTAAAFWTFAQAWAGPFFPLPAGINAAPANLISLITPSAIDSQFAFGFFHLPLAAVVMGLFMYVSIHRVGPILAAIAGLTLAYCSPIFQVSPVVWGLIPMLFISVIIGLGIEGLALASRADKKWVMLSVIAMLALTVLTSWQSYYVAASMYALAAVVSICIFIMTKNNIRLHSLRWSLITVTVAIDITLTAQLIVDHLH